MYVIYSSENSSEMSKEERIIELWKEYYKKLEALEYYYDTLLKIEK